MISEDGEFVRQRGQMMTCPEDGQQLVHISLSKNYPHVKVTVFSSVSSLTCFVPPSWPGPGWTVPAGSR